MKRIIDGVTYNTETATLIYRDALEGSWNDYKWQSESLYKTRSGRFFLHGEGGAGTKYGKAVSTTSRAGGEQIKPISEDDARRWLEQFEAPDEICPELFPGAEETETESVIYLRVPSFLKTKLEAKAKEQGKSLNALLMRTIEELL